MPNNTILTSSIITKEALRILHQKLNFVGSMNRAYDSSFAQSGAKIGDSLRIRLPNKYTVRDGATLSAQDTVETSTTLQVATQKGVDLNFTSNELTLSLDDFSKRILEPAMAQLSASIESDAFNMVKDVPYAVGANGSAITFKNVLEARKKLADNLAPSNDRTLILNTQDNVDLVDSLKGLFQDSATIAQQYKEGMVGKTAGYSAIYENTLLPNFSFGAGTGYLVNGASQSGSSLIVDTGTGALPKGTVFTIANVFAVHPESRLSTGVLQQFVVTANYTGGGGTVSIYPAITASGAYQTVNAVPADNASISIYASASADVTQSLAFQKDAFTFATADLVMPKGVDFSAREVYDGISMRVVRQYDINNDAFPCRLDVLYGYKTIRPELACRILAN
jgi:hypothetical protein